jgi:hypothetical protein
MTKILYGGTAADFTANVTDDAVDGDGNPVPNVMLLAPAVSLIGWNAGSGGAQIADLRLFDGDYLVPGSAADTFPSDDRGSFIVWAEDDLEFFFVSTPGEPTRRWAAHPINLHQRLRAVEQGAQVGVVDAVNALKGVAGGIAGLTDPDGLVDISDLPVGSGAGTVAAGNRVWGLANMPAGYRHTQVWDGAGTMPNRDTPRADLRVIWESPEPPQTGPNQAIPGDRWENINP